MSMNPLSRRQARELALQFLYSQPEVFAKEPFSAFIKSFNLDDDEFAWSLVEGTGKNIPELDCTISTLSTNWRIERMSIVDLSILRLATYEILFRSDIPKTVSINEAVELAKKYGAEDSASFINGILDKITKPS